MVKEKSVGCALFRKNNSGKEFLLLHYKAGHWGFPKGHMEQGETEAQTLRRELREETALENIAIMPGFRQYTKYYFRRGQETVFKEVAFYLAESEKGKVKISHEHQGFEWLPYKTAMERLSFKNTKTVLKKAIEFFKEKNENCC